MPMWTPGYSVCPPWTPTATKVLSTRTFRRRRRIEAGCGRKILEEVSRDGPPSVQRRSRSFAQRVRPVRVEHHVEILPELNQLVHQTFGVLDVHVVVAGAVHQQQVAAQSFREVDRRAAAISLGVVVR